MCLIQQMERLKWSKWNAQTQNWTAQIGFH